MSADLKTSVQDALRGALVLPMIPRVVSTTLALLRDTRSGPREVAHELSQDPILAARVLRLANSPYFAGKRSVASIEDAVSIIGEQALGTLLIAAGVRAAFANMPGVDMRSFWLHAAVSAAGARALARQVGIDSEAAYLSGLLHETGHLILCQTFAEAAKRHFEPRPGLHGRPLAAEELLAFGVSHPEVTGMWSRSLQLPDAVTDAVTHCLDPQLAQNLQLATVVHFGASLALDIAEGASADVALTHVDQRLAALAQFDLVKLTVGFAEQYERLREAGHDI